TTDGRSAPAAVETVNESWKLMPNSAAPEDTSVSGEVLLYGRNCTSRPASRNQPSCWATKRPVWLVLGVQSSATRIGCVPPSPPPQPASSRARTAARAARTRGVRTDTVSSLRRYYPGQVRTVGGRSCRPLSLGTRGSRGFAGQDTCCGGRRTVAHVTIAARRMPGRTGTPTRGTPLIGWVRSCGSSHAPHAPRTASGLPAPAGSTAAQKRLRILRESPGVTRVEHRVISNLR